MKASKLRSIDAILVAGALVLSTLHGPASAEKAYPERPITLVVPAPAGGGTDILGRVVADGLTKRLGKSVIVENRGGGSGMIAADLVLQAPADGYTLFMVFSGVMTVNQSLYKNTKYDPLKDFVPIANFAQVPNLLIVHPSLPATSVTELIALAKERPGKLNYASSGNGVSNHLAMELFKQMTGIEMLHVPYRGGAPAMVDLIGGQVDLMFNNMVEVTPHAEAGRVRTLAIATAERSPVLPDLPTVSESGVPGYSVNLWYGVVGATGIPENVVNLLNRTIQEIQDDPEVQARLDTLGAQPVKQSPGEFSRMIREEAQQWAKVIKEGNITVD